jgi:hypothetical protein
MRTASIVLTAGLLVAAGSLLLEGQAQQGASIAAVAGQKGGWDLTGPYDVVRDWPKPLSSLPGHENWTWGSVQAGSLDEETRCRCKVPSLNEETSQCRCKQASLAGQTSRCRCKHPSLVGAIPAAPVGA